MFFFKTKMAAVATTEAASIQTATPRSSKRQKGFTLLELGFVVGLISIIVGGFAVYQNTDNAKATRAYADMVTLKNAILRFRADVGVNPILFSDLWKRVESDRYQQYNAAKWAGPYIRPADYDFPFSGGDVATIYPFGVNLNGASEAIWMLKNVYTAGGFTGGYDGPVLLRWDDMKGSIAKLILSKCDSYTQPLITQPEELNAALLNGSIECGVILEEGQQFTNNDRFSLHMKVTH